MITDPEEVARVTRALELLEALHGGAATTRHHSELYLGIRDILQSLIPQDGQDGEDA